MFRMKFLTGFVIGYVLGSRAGRERYEQIRRATRTLQESQTVQSAAGVLQQQARELVDAARQRL